MEFLRASAVAGMRTLSDDLESGDFHRFAELFSEAAYQRVRQGMDVSLFNGIISIVEGNVRDMIHRVAPGEERLFMVEQCHAVCNSARAGIMDAYGVEAHVLVSGSDSPGSRSSVAEHR